MPTVNSQLPMISSPQLSVITPVFNGIRFIEFCIQNVIDQRCREAEHLIIDGGSTDGSVEIIRKFAGMYPHIRWVSEQDKGQSDAMNKGIARAAGKILSFLNVDDYYEPGALNDVIPRFHSLPEPTLLVGNCNVWGEDGKLMSVCRPAQISLLELLRANYDNAFPLNPSAYFYHKSLHDRIGLYDVDENFGMDVHFIFKAVQAAHVVYVDRLWGNYRYLENTKTFQDVVSGMNSVRVKNITDHYRRLQPFHVKAWLSLTELTSRLLRKY
jgi:glycosyltransferase involved in cell wall biosynthesis